VPIRSEIAKQLEAKLGFHSWRDTLGNVRDALIEASCELEELRTRQNGWISVEERLPEPRTDVLLHVVRLERGKLAHEWVQIASMRNDGQWIDDDSTIGYRERKKPPTDGKYPKHWQPLPAAPGADAAKDSVPSQVSEEIGAGAKNTSGRSDRAYEIPCPSGCWCVKDSAMCAECWPNRAVADAEVREPSDNGIKLPDPALTELQEECQRLREALRRIVEREWQASIDYGQRAEWDKVFDEARAVLVASPDRGRKSSGDGIGGEISTTDQSSSSLDDRSQLLEALRKLKSYNEDIMAGRINYRPEDHIAVILGASPDLS
jgi:hypothetical protein